jgi:hypothetical protein
MRMRTVLMSGCFAVLMAVPVPAQAQRLSLPGVLSAPLHILRGITGAVRGQVYRGRHGVPRSARRAVPPATAAAAAATAETTGSASTGSYQSRNVAASAWSGPLFWPNAYDGMFEYAFGTDDGAKFWARGYGDVVESMFVPPRGPRVAEASTDGKASSDAKRAWIDLCGGETEGSAQAISNRIRDAVKPTEQQTAAFEEMASSLERGFQAIKAVCPSDQAATPTERLNLMIARLSGMRQAVLAVSAGAKSFYSTLSDEQKAAFDGPADVNAGALCAGGPIEWPQREIARTLRPTRQQYPELERLRQTSMHLGQFVGSTCPGERPKTTVERLDAVMERLSALRYAALNTGPALNRFYLALNNDQKSRLGASASNARAEVQR